MTQPPPQDESATVIPDCPRCQGPMWDNRVGKRNPKAPDFKCKDRGCDGVVWPPRGATAVPAAVEAPADSSAPVIVPPAPGMPACPICGGAMWDDRTSKRNPRAPDFKCRNKPRERGGAGCEGVIWPSRDGAASPYPAGAPRLATTLRSPTRRPPSTTPRRTTTTTCRSDRQTGGGRVRCRCGGCPICRMS
jgi:hypothetical protein